MAYVLRDYQERALESAREVMGAGVKEFVFQSPTGSGKTLIAAAIILTAVQRGNRVLFLAHREELLWQAIDKLVEMGVPRRMIGLIKAKADPLGGPTAPVQVASVQTLRRRALPIADIVFVDETHLAAAAGYRAILAGYPDAYVVGLTATPERPDGKPLDMFRRIVVVATPLELAAAGHIVAPRVVSVDDEALPDGVDDIRIQNGDFHAGDVHQRVTTQKVIGALADHWAEHARGLRTIAFAATVEHGRLATAAYAAAGIRALFAHGEMPKAERDAAVQALRDGTVDILVNVGLWTEGLDVPEAKALCMLRLTRSIVVHMQTGGRIMRPWQGVRPVVCDHTGNYVRLGSLLMPREFSLEGRARRAAAGLPPGKKCPCGEVVDRDVKVCPACNTAFGVEKRIVQVDGRLVELDDGYAVPGPAEPPPDTRPDEFARLWRAAYRDGNDRAWVIRQFVARFGEPPPLDWEAPPRPPVTDTPAQKQAALNGFVGAAHRQNLPLAWAHAKYRNRYGEDPPGFGAVVAPVKIDDAPAARG